MSFNDPMMTEIYGELKNCYLDLEDEKDDETISLPPSQTQQSSSHMPTSLNLLFNKSDTTLHRTHSKQVATLSSIVLECTETYTFNFQPQSLEHGDLKAYPSRQRRRFN